MANIAVIFHWGPSEMDHMYVEELARWHDKALARNPNQSNDPM